MALLTIDTKNIANSNLAGASIQIDLVKKNFDVPILAPLSTGDDVILSTTFTGTTNSDGVATVELTPTEQILQKSRYKITIGSGNKKVSRYFQMPTTAAYLKDRLDAEQIDPVPGGGGGGGNTEYVGIRKWVSGTIYKRYQPVVESDDQNAVIYRCKNPNGCSGTQRPILDTANWQETGKLQNEVVHELVLTDYSWVAQGATLQAGQFQHVTFGDNSDWRLKLKSTDAFDIKAGDIFRLENTGNTQWLQGVVLSTSTLSSSAGATLVIRLTGETQGAGFNTGPNTGWTISRIGNVLVRVFTDDTLTGKGTERDPLSVVGGGGGDATDYELQLNKVKLPGAWTFVSGDLANTDTSGEVGYHSGSPGRIKIVTNDAETQAIIRKWGVVKSRIKVGTLTLTLTLQYAESPTGTFILTGTSSGSAPSAGTTTVEFLEPFAEKNNISADDVSVDASGFDGNLATTDTDVQKVAQKLDDLSTGGGGNAAAESTQVQAEAGTDSSAANATRMTPRRTAQAINALASGANESTQSQAEAGTDDTTANKSRMSPRRVKQAIGKLTVPSVDFAVVTSTNAPEDSEIIPRKTASTFTSNGESLSDAVYSLTLKVGNSSQNQDPSQPTTDTDAVNISSVMDEAISRGRGVQFDFEEWNRGATPTDTNRTASVRCGAVSKSGDTYTLTDIRWKDGSNAQDNNNTFLKTSAYALVSPLGITDGHTESTQTQAETGGGDGSDRMSARRSKQAIGKLTVPQVQFAVVASTETVRDSQIIPRKTSSTFAANGDLMNTAVYSLTLKEGNSPYDEDPGQPATDHDAVNISSVMDEAVARGRGVQLYFEEWNDGATPTDTDRRATVRCGTITKSSAIYTLTDIRWKDGSNAQASPSTFLKVTSYALISPDPVEEDAGGGDITGITAGDGLTGGGSTGDVTVSADLGDGLEFDSGQSGNKKIQVDLDGSTLTKGSSGLKVSHGGITSNEIQARAVDLTKIATGSTLTGILSGETKLMLNDLGNVKLSSAVEWYANHHIGTQTLTGYNYKTSAVDSSGTAGDINFASLGNITLVAKSNSDRDKILSRIVKDQKIIVKLSDTAYRTGIVSTFQQTSNHFSIVCTSVSTEGTLTNDHAASIITQGGIADRSEFYDFALNENEWDTLPSATIADDDLVVFSDKSDSYKIKQTEKGNLFDLEQLRIDEFIDDPDTVSLDNYNIVSAISGSQPVGEVDLTQTTGNNPVNEVVITAQSTVSGNAGNNRVFLTSVVAGDEVLVHQTVQNAYIFGDITGVSYLNSSGTPTNDASQAHIIKYTITIDTERGLDQYDQLPAGAGRVHFRKPAMKRDASNSTEDILFLN